MRRPRLGWWWVTPTRIVPPHIVIRILIMMIGRRIVRIVPFVWVRMIFQRIRMYPHCPHPPHPRWYSHSRVTNVKTTRMIVYHYGSTNTHNGIPKRYNTCRYMVIIRIINMYYYDVSARIRDVMVPPIDWKWYQSFWNWLTWVNVYSSFTGPDHSPWKSF